MVKTKVVATRCQSAALTKGKLMPAISSSTRTGTSLRLFAGERKALEKCREICQWIHDNAQGMDGSEEATDASTAIERVLASLPAATDKATTKQPV